jgi:hypothetical protein
MVTSSNVAFRNSGILSTHRHGLNPAPCPPANTLLFAGGESDSVDFTPDTFAATPGEEHLFRIPEAQESTPALMRKTVDMINKARVYEVLYGPTGQSNLHLTYGQLKPKLIDIKNLQEKSVKAMLLGDDYFRSMLRIEFGLSRGGHLNPQRSEFRNKIEEIATSGPKLWWGRVCRAMDNA